MVSSVSPRRTCIIMSLVAKFVRHYCAAQVVKCCVNDSHVLTL